MIVHYYVLGGMLHIPMQMGYILNSLYTHCV
jgi:hypothetical protein